MSPLKAHVSHLTVMNEDRLNRAWIPSLVYQFAAVVVLFSVQYLLVFEASNFLRRIAQHVAHHLVGILP